MEEKKKLKIMLVSSYAFTDEPSGVRDFILGLKFALQKKGHIVTVIAPGSKDAWKKGFVDYVLGKDFRITTDQTEFRGSLSRKKTAKEILKKVHPDIIVIHEPFVPTVGHTIISAKPTCPIVGQFHARREDLGFRFKALEFIGKHLVRRPKLNKRTILSLSSGYISTVNSNLDARIAVSQATKKFWQRKYPSGYKVIYNGIDTDELSMTGANIDSWKNPPAATSDMTGGGKKIIFFAGRHDNRKGIDDLIDAFDLLIKSGVRDIRLMIAGKGEMTRVLEKMVKKLDLQKFIQFVGVLPRTELVKAYNSSDLVVAPSTGGEGFNRTIIEARSCGALVVCTNIEGQKEAIGKDLFEFMVKPHDPKSLATQIKTVLGLPESKKQEIRRLGREEVKSRFGWESIAKEHIDFYESLISKYGNSQKHN